MRQYVQDSGPERVQALRTDSRDRLQLGERPGVRADDRLHRLVVEHLVGLPPALSGFLGAIPAELAFDTGHLRTRAARSVGVRGDSGGTSRDPDGRVFLAFRDQAALGEEELDRA